MQVNKNTQIEKDKRKGVSGQTDYTAIENSDEKKQDMTLGLLQFTIF